MDVSVLDAAVDAMVMLADPFRLAMLSIGVFMGLVVGIIPGIGGLAGMAILLPFTFTMDSHAAFALVLGMAAVTTTSDTIPAVLFGVPGTSGSQATVLDGFPMARNGEAGRTLSAAFTASLLGGLCGAALLALCIPVLRPIILFIGAPELLALSILGIAMVSVLSGNTPARGLIAAGIGVMLSMVGADSQTATYRWTFDSTYLWAGVPLVPMALGLFALPELAELASNRRSIAAKSRLDTRAGMTQGVRDAFRNIWLLMRCGVMGAGLGAVPGIGASVIDWIVYGYARQTVKGARKTFGSGDVRGVIAPESANNAINSGTLVPTIAFGVPGSASMTLLLSVLMIHGLTPGREMLTTNLSTTYSMTWSIALANVLGAGICFALSGQLARIALLRHTFILPLAISFVVLGAFQTTRSWGDIYSLLAFGVLGWGMKQLDWPRPPLILGFVLGALIERYMFITSNLFGSEWLLRPIVIVLLSFAALVALGPIARHFSGLGGPAALVRDLRLPTVRLRDFTYLFVLVVAGTLLLMAFDWPHAARFGPVLVGSAVCILAIVGFANQIFTHSVPGRVAVAARTEETAPCVDDDTPVALVSRRSLRLFGYLVGFVVSIAFLGFLASVPLLAIAYMRIEGRERWTSVMIYAASLTGAVYLIFDRILRIPWPTNLISSIL